MIVGYTIFDMITDPLLEGCVFDTSEKSINTEAYFNFSSYKRMYSWRYKKLFLQNSLSGKHLLEALLDDCYKYGYRQNKIMRKPYLSLLLEKIGQVFQEKGGYQKDICIQYTYDEMTKKTEKTLAEHSRDAYKERMKIHREASKIEDFSDEYARRKVSDITFGFLFVLEQYGYLKIGRIVYEKRIFSIYLSFSDRFLQEWSAGERNIFREDHETRVHTFKYLADGILINGFLWTMEGGNLPDRFFRLVCKYFSLQQGKQMVSIEELKLYNTPESGITNEQLKAENIRKNYIPKINETFRKWYNNPYMRTVKILDIHSSFIKAKRLSVKGSENMRDLFTS